METLTEIALPLLCPLCCPLASLCCSFCPVFAGVGPLVTPPEVLLIIHSVAQSSGLQTLCTKSDRRKMKGRRTPAARGPAVPTWSILWRWQNRRAGETEREDSWSPFLHGPTPQALHWGERPAWLPVCCVLLMNQPVTLAILWVWFFTLLHCSRTMVGVSLCLESTAAAGTHSQGHGVAQRYLRPPW